MVNTPLIYADCFPKSFASALGLSNIIGAVAALLLGPVMDKLKEFSGSYNMPLYFFSRLMLFFLILWIAVNTSLGNIVNTETSLKKKISQYGCCLPLAALLAVLSNTAVESFETEMGKGPEVTHLFGKCCKNFAL